MSHGARVPDREHVFRSMYESVYPDLLRFVQRRARPDQVEDVVADACLIVWRRLDQLPGCQDDARAWVFGITRNVLLTKQRGERRRRAVAVRLADPSTSAAPVDPAADEVVSRIDLGKAWNRLSEVHQEALSLAVFEELRAPQAAAVVGISPVAFRLRLSRARRALRLHLDQASAPSRRPVDISERTTAS